MFELEWLGSTDALAMISLLQKGVIQFTQKNEIGIPVLRERTITPPSDRKLRLCACACMRLHFQVSNVEQIQAVKEAEIFADGGPRPKNGFYFACREGIPVTLFFTGAPAEYAQVIRDIFGNPWREVSCTQEEFFRLLAWNNRTVPRLAQAIYDDYAFERMPILADALEEAGFQDASILSHSREPGPHVKGCWLIDLILGKS